MMREQFTLIKFRRSSIEQIHKTDTSIFEHCSPLTAPHIHRSKRHNLLDSVALSICWVIWGGEDGWKKIEEFGQATLDWLKTCLELPNGIPSHDPIGRVLSRLWPGQFHRSVPSWIHRLSPLTEGQVAAIDGKQEILLYCARWRWTSWNKLNAAQEGWKRRAWRLDGIMTFWPTSFLPGPFSGWRGTLFFEVRKTRQPLPIDKSTMSQRIVSWSIERDISCSPLFSVIQAPVRNRASGSNAPEQWDSRWPFDWQNTSSWCLFPLFQ